jgi:hypothetical protein
MIDPKSQTALKQEIRNCLQEDKILLDILKAEIAPLKSSVRRIQPRSTTAISLVGTDGGNNKLEFDPFLIQVVRVVDSSNNEYCLQVVTPSTSISLLDKKQFDEKGSPVSALGEMMDYLGVRSLVKLSHMIRMNEKDKPTSPSWLQVYRELVEWAILFSIVRKKDFGTDTLIVCDGLLRSKVFAGDFFKRYLEGLKDAIDKQESQNHRKIYIVGVAKHSKVLTRYRLAMALEGILRTNYPAYIEIPREIEEKAYVWNEYARGEDRVTLGAEINKFVGGKMFFVKFGNKSRDPIWPVDIFLPQRDQVAQIFGYMLADSINGFPIPFYPACLQKAHENAALVDFDFDILQDQIYDAIGTVVSDPTALDTFRIQDVDPADRRY